MLLFASLPPRGWWWVGVAGLALLAVALRDLPWRRRVACGYLAGLGLFGPALAWVAGFSLAGAVLLVALEAGFLGVTAGLVLRGRVLLLPPALVLGEWLRRSWPFGGFPLAGPALGQVDAPFASTAALAGPLAVVAVAGIIGVALSELVGGRRGRAVGLVVAGVVAASSGGMAASATAPAGRDLQVTVVQGGGPRGIPAVVSDAAEVFRRHLERSRAIPARTDLVVWPEGVVDVAGPVAGTAEADQLAALAARTGATLVVGVTEDAAGNRFRNAAVAWTPTGELADRYEKVHRVPFGEYVPARSLVSRVADLSLVPRDAIAGSGPGLLTTPAGRIGVAISFEVFFPDRTRAAVRAGAQLLVVPTNAASFTTDEVPAQELAAARLRAVETGRSVVQAAPTGYSAIIGPDGAVRARSRLGAPQVLAGDVPLRRGRTPYVRVGDAPVVALAMAVLVLAAGRGHVAHRYG